MARTSLLLVLLFSGSLKADHHTMKLVGEARLNVLFWSVYDAQLYTSDGFYREHQAPLLLKLRYLQDFTSEELVTQTEKEWQRLGVDNQISKPWLTELATLWPDVKESDTLSFKVDCNQQSHFLFNQKKLGTIKDPAFGKEFIAIWLSEKTSQPQLREKLINKKSISRADRTPCQPLL